MLLEYSLPRALWRGPAAGIIDATPAVTKQELLSAMEPGDLLLVNTPEAKIVGFAHGAAGQVTKAAMGIPYSSIKMVASDGRLVGYGLRKALPAQVGLDVASAGSYARSAREMLLLRPKAGKAQKIAAVGWMMSRVGLPFDVAAMRLSAFRRLGRPVPVERSRMVELQPMFCSNMIAYAYLSTGVRLVPDVENAWPTDFLESGQCEKVCKYTK